jgi:hypothetical protein
MGQRLPLVPSVPSYVFGTSLGDAQYRIAMRWNARAGTWFMDLMEDDETPIRMGIRVVLGARLGGRTADHDPRFPQGDLVARDLSGEGREAGIDDLGVRVVIDYTPPDELELLRAEAA